MSVSLHLTVKVTASGKWAATIRRDDTTMPYALTRAFVQRRDADRWLLENAKAELASAAAGPVEAA